MARAIELSLSESEAVEKVAGAVWRTALGKNPSEILERVVELATALDSLLPDADAIAKPLAEERLDTLGQLEWAAGLAARILALEPVPRSWLRRWAIDDLEREARGAKALQERLERAEARLGEDFSDSLVELVDEDMLVRYRADHQSFWRRLGGAYRRDQRTLRGQLRRPLKLSFEESLAAVALARRSEAATQTMARHGAAPARFVRTALPRTGDRLATNTQGSGCFEGHPRGLARRRQRPA